MQFLVLLCLFLLPREILTRKLTKEENIMLKKECGAHKLNHTRNTGRRTRSMGAEKVEPMPWIALLFSSANGISGYCSAVQISRRHILTAAHCVAADKLDDKQREIECESHRDFNTKRRLAPNLTYELRDHNEVYVTGTYTGHMNRRYLSSIKMEIEGLPYVHEEYDPCLADNDLAVIELKSDVPRKLGSPICMRENEELADMLTSAGYGRDPKHPDKGDDIHWLQKLDIDSKDVKESMETITASLDEKSVCEGDSGSPLVQLNHENKYALVGMASKISPKSCDIKVDKGQKRISIFVNVKSHLDWICFHTGVCSIQHMGSHQDGNLYKALMSNGKMKSPIEDAD